MLEKNNLSNYQQRKIYRKQQHFISPQIRRNNSITPTKNSNTKIVPKIVFRIGDNPQQLHKDPAFYQSKLSQFLTVPTANGHTKINGSIHHNPNIQKYHNLSTHNLHYLRTTLSPAPITCKPQPRNRSKEVVKHKQPQVKTRLNVFFKSKRQCNKTTDALEDKKVKETPSFIKNKVNHGNSSFMLDFKIIRSIKTEQQYKELIVLHIKTRSLYTMKVYKKTLILRQTGLFEEIKHYLKQELNHNLIIKYYGCFSDADYFYLIEQFIEGQTLHKFIQTHPITEQEIGPKICEILTALSYIHSLGLSHGSITQQNIINTLGVCKLKRPFIISQRREFLFDIWALGRIAFEMLTGNVLIVDSLLQNCNTIKDLFDSPGVVYGIETGFKCFENSKVSRQAIKFLITTLWDIQSKELKLNDVWQLQFIKLYREDDMWQSCGN